MPRKQQPKVVDVLEYFESAPLDAARLALELAARAVKKREPKLASEGVKKPRKTLAEHVQAAQAAAPAPVATTQEVKAPRATRGTAGPAPIGAGPSAPQTGVGSSGTSSVPAV